MNLYAGYFAMHGGIDPMGEECCCSRYGEDDDGAWDITKDVLGKLWNGANSALGLGLGLIGTVGDYIPFVGDFNASVGLGNNAIEFYNQPTMPFGALTLGNTIHYPGDPGSGFGPNYFLEDEGHSLGTHELQHTYQGEALGPLYLPANITGGIFSTLTSGNWHDNNFMEEGPMSNPACPW